MDWKTDAEYMYFTEKLNISEIAGKVGRSRKAVSNLLKALPGYQQEKQRRADESLRARQDYKREWDRTSRVRKQPVGLLSIALLKRQHEIDVNVLSHERF